MRLRSPVSLEQWPVGGWGGCRGWRWVDGWQGPRNGCITKSILGFKIWSSPTVDATDGWHLCEFTLFRCSFFCVWYIHREVLRPAAPPLTSVSIKQWRNMNQTQKARDYTETCCASFIIWRIVDGYCWSLLQVCLNLTMQRVVFGKGTFLVLVRSSGAATHEGLLVPVKPFRTSRLHRVFTCDETRRSFHSASAVNWAHSDCVNPGHVAVSLQSRTRFYLLKWWLLSWEVVLSAAVAANFVGGEKCWFIVLFFPQHQQKYGGLWKHLWRHSWFQVKLNNFEVCHKIKLILHFMNILYYAITFNIYLI